MNKELRELLNRINAKKAEAKDLLAQDKIEEARAAKEELQKLQNKFDLMKDLYDQEEEDFQEDLVNENTTVVGQKKPNVVNAFVNVFKALATKVAAKEEDVKILNMMTQADPVDGVSDGGLTVPQDISTEIKELRRSLDALENLVNVEPVSTLSGSRVIEINADYVPFDNVDEAADFPDADTPQFKNIPYKVKKKGGILKITRELLQDTAENIIRYLRGWIAKKARTTRNFLILAELDRSFGGDKTKTIETLDDFKDIFNVELDPAIALSSRVLTNQDGFNWLDKLKDKDGKYVLQPNAVDTTKQLLFGKYPVTVVSNKVLKSTDNIAPFYCGDLKEAITLFDRENLSIEFSTEAGDLWKKDLTGVKVRERLDIKTIDEEAVIKAEAIVNDTIGGVRA